MKTYQIIYVPETGVEPARPYGQRCLRPHCLPIPTFGHITTITTSTMYISGFNNSY